MGKKGFAADLRIFHHVGGHLDEVFSAINTTFDRIGIFSSCDHRHAARFNVVSNPLPVEEKPQWEALFVFV